MHPNPPQTSNLEQALEQAILRHAREALKSVPASLSDAILYSLLGGGKRVRPRMMVTLGDQLGLSREVSFRLGTSLEMVHTYTLIHDDLPAMDNDDLRRGKPTNHKVYGEAHAILAGDSLALLAFDTLAPLENFACINALLEASGARGVIGGQVAELELRNLNPPTLENLLDVFRLKTGALFKAALVLPALAAGHTTDSALVSILSEFGEAIGIAFQIADDLEDDFSVKSKDSAHIASYLTASGARIKAKEVLDHPYSALKKIDAAIANALSPHLEELSNKILGTSDS